MSNSVLGNANYPLAMTLAYSIQMFFHILSQEDRMGENRPGESHEGWDDTSDYELLDYFVYSEYGDANIPIFDSYSSAMSITKPHWYEGFE